jgi:short subunit dehydrogenase-like uncharacterized protein
MTTRAFDLVLFGATGFTGKLVAEYLLAHAPAGLRWALAGRSQTKLEAVRSDLAATHPNASALPLLIADSDDSASVDALAKQARVVITTVGPYMKYGRALVSACAENGTHYCDLTGETPFIRDTIDRCHARAQETGARIVHTCGFDSIPSDLGVLMMHEHAKAQGQTLSRVRFFLGESRGGGSGGTVASMFEIAQAARGDAKVRRLLGDPYALNPDRKKERGPDGSDQMGVHYDGDLKMWTGPFLMASINTRVVRRSNALLDYAYGRDFRYSESMSFGKGPKGMLIASAVSAGLAGFVATAAFAPGRSLLARILPKVGEGPSKEARERGYFVVRLIADAQSKDGTASRFTGRVVGKSDPGYGETAKMLSESALCLALDGDKLTSRGGVLTPASAMGTRLIERLRAAGMEFEIRA